MVGHILRFDPRYVQVFQAAAPEKLGDADPSARQAQRHPRDGEAARRRRARSCSTWASTMSTPCNGSRARRITRVYAQKVEVLGTGNEDALYAVVNFENGAIGSIDYSWAWPDGLMNGFRSSLEIVGTQIGRLSRLHRPGLLRRRRRRNERRRHASLAGDQRPHRRRPRRRDRPFRQGHACPARPIVQHYREAFDAIPVLDALARVGANRRSGRSGALN